MKNPLHQIVRDDAELMRSLARELGLTPSARTGLTGGTMLTRRESLEDEADRLIGPNPRHLALARIAGDDDR